MNAWEELAVMELAGAVTAESRTRAIGKLLHGRGVRITPDAKRALHEAWTLAPSAVALAAHPVDKVAGARLNPGPEPILPPDARAVIDEWVEFWLNADKLLAAGAVPPGALLLHGPPGTGKTMTTAWLAGRFADRWASFTLDAHDYVRSHMGETGEMLLRVFRALGSAKALIVFEEIDAVGTTRGEGGQAAAAENNRSTIALMRLIEGSKSPIVATTNRLDVLDPALLRRFDAVVALPEPSPEMLTAIAQHALGRELRAGEWFKGDSVVEIVREAKQLRRREALARPGAAA